MLQFCLITKLVQVVFITVILTKDQGKQYYLPARKSKRRPHQPPCRSEPSAASTAIRREQGGLGDASRLSDDAPSRSQWRNWRTTRHPVGAPLLRSPNPPPRSLASLSIGVFPAQRPHLRVFGAGFCRIAGR